MMRRYYGCLPCLIRRLFVNRTAGLLTVAICRPVWSPRIGC